jgi:hypothetical protein
MKKVSHPVEPRICYRKANPLYLANNQIQAKYIELGDKAEKRGRSAVNKIKTF